MPWIVAGSRLALMLRRLRGRFGIAAPQVTVRTHVPWYFRIMALAGIVILSVALVGWAYDAGQLIAGFDQNQTSHDMDELRAANKNLEEEVAHLRSLLTASEGNLQIEQAAQRQLAEKNSMLAGENDRLKEDLAVFERLAKLENRANNEVSLDRLRIEPDGHPGRYRFSFLIALQGARRGKEAKFNMQIHLSPRGGGDGAKIVLPRQDEVDVSKYEIELRNFRRIEGKFDVPANFGIGVVEMRILEGDQMKVSQSLAL